MRFIPNYYLTAYTEDIVETFQAFMVNHHLYADDTQLQNHMRREAIQANCRKMEQCVSAMKDWCSSRRLQLNAHKTEVICFDGGANIKKLSQLDTKLHLGSIVAEPVTLVRNLGVYVESELNMRVHIGKYLLPVSTIYIVFVNFETSCPHLQYSVSYLHLFSLDWITATQ